MTTPLPESVDSILRLLADRIGLDAASVGENLIRTGVRQRMKQLGLERQADYERILLGPTGEAQALIEEVVIPESWFFRDERPFEALSELARTGWLEHPTRPPLSVLCLPCANGEEPYSVVMTLLDLGLPRERFEVVAIDVSERSIMRAARGIYGINSFRGVADSTRDRYFDWTDTPGRYLLKASVRAAVRFERGNILDSQLLADHAGFAVVFCRNLLIYFDDAARALATRNLDRLSADDGYLFLGHADRPEAGLATRFVQHGSPGYFLYRRRDATPTICKPESPPPTSARHRPAAPSRPASPRPVTTPSAGLASLPRSTPPVSTSVGGASGTARRDQPVSDEFGYAEALAQAASLADRGQYYEAAEVARRHLGRGPLDAPAHALLGMIHQAAGDRTQAEAELLKAVYLDPEHDESLLALALLARRRGDVAAEALFRRRAERVRARKGQT